MTDLELYNKAKEAYYNGEPIMDDFEFDELEKKLGLENKSYIGAKKNPSYTVNHPFLMGSLAKVQIKEDNSGNINFADYLNEVNKYINRNGANKFIVTPKFDGCSFEAVIEEKKVKSISSRGDGELGKDLYKHLINKVMPNVKAINDQNSNIGYVLRGEVLIDKFIFEQKYSEFVNPRSFVSGILNRDYTEDAQYQEMLNDLSIVIYDIRIKLDDGSGYADIDWNEFNFPDSPKYFFTINSEITSEEFEKLYNDFNEYRSEDCPFALDGIVFKPQDEFRESNIGIIEHRPKDCVAVKFAPMLQETEIVDIKWQLSNKTGEYTPVIIVNPVIMDGKQITKASAHNYGYVLENKISKGTKVILSLAGDIIPFIYKITDTSAFDEKNICIDTTDCTIDGVHLYKNLSPEEITKNKFLASARSLGIPSIGPAAAEKIFDFVKIECQGDEFFGIEPKEVPDNILLIQPVDINRGLGGKSGVNAAKAFNDYLTKMTIKDIIISCAFNMCGEKAAEQIVKFMIEPGSEDWTSLPGVSYNWCFNDNSPEMIKVQKIMNAIGKTVDQERQVAIETKKNLGDQIPVILTGEPNDYLSKGDFLAKHPEYRMTGSWKEVQIVFTNSLDSNTGKMKKAREKGIEIRLY
ncbi:MAG: hypothetical protein IJH39_04405 [Clostridia bacterium]|nr:hypothetical protein [Clostridia bacterium]